MLNIYFQEIHCVGSVDHYGHFRLVENTCGIYVLSRFLSYLLCFRVKAKFPQF